MRQGPRSDGRRDSPKRASRLSSDDLPAFVEELISGQREMAARQKEMEKDLAYLVEGQRTLLAAAKHILAAATGPSEDDRIRGHHDGDRGREREPTRQRNNEHQRESEPPRARGNGDVEKETPRARDRGETNTLRERGDSRGRDPRDRGNGGRSRERGGSRGRDPRDAVRVRDHDDVSRVNHRSPEAVRQRSPLKRRRPESPQRRGVFRNGEQQGGPRGVRGRSQSEEDGYWQRSMSPREHSLEARRERSQGHRSRSRSQFTLNAKMPHNHMQDDSCTFEEAQILERPSGTSGDAVWQAEIEISKLTTAPNGNKRSFTVRGPPRKNREQAEEDSKKLTAAASDGAKAVRGLANRLHRS